MSAKTIPIAGKKFKIRSLRRKESRYMRREMGINLMDLKKSQADEAMDHVFEVVLDEADFKKTDDLKEMDAIKLFEAIIKETYGDPQEEANLKKSGPGTQTETESPTVESADE